MFRRAPGVRLRPIPELGTCLAFVATPPRLHTLNPAAWLIAELCERHEGEALRQEFVRRSVPPWSETDALRQFDAGVQRLLSSGIITDVHSKRMPE